MIIIPAIDILNGKAVRLYKGDYSKEEFISNDIVKLAKNFEKDGARYIHVVDLDGAKKGQLVNVNAIEQIVKSVNANIEVGGGIRDVESIDKLVKIGVARIILGTSAIENKEFLVAAINKYREKIAVAVDFKGNNVCTNGWISNSGKHYIEFCEELQDIGVKNIIVTDISKDGTLEGTNVQALKELSEILNINITASGGIKDLKDIKKLKNLSLYGAITGKAIYSKTLNLKEAINLTNIN